MKDLIGCLFFIILLIVVVIGWTYLISNAENEIKSIDNAYKASVGKRIVIDKDTLTITDYSKWSGSFKLSNGAEIDSAFIKIHPLL